MHRFFVQPTCIDGHRATLDGDLAHQLARVLRMSPGDEIILLDNSGKEYGVRLTSFARDVVEGEVISVSDGRGEPGARVSLYQSTLKGERFQWVLQKGTELGVSTFVPVICRRSVRRERDGRDTGRYHRWQKIIAEAAEQSGRCVLPVLRRAVEFEDACRGITPDNISIIPWEREEATGLGAALHDKGSRHVNLFIGPEGGFEEEEVDFARSRGAVPVSLGRRILRSETAAIATVAAVMYEMGEYDRLNSTS